MEDLKRKYARFLIDGCLDLRAGDKLFIIGEECIQDFIDIVMSVARQLGIDDIETLITNSYKQKEIYLTEDYESIITNPLFDKTKYNEMARNGYAFLMLSSPIPGIFEDVDSELLSKVNTYQASSIQEYREYQNKGTIKWNISAVPNDDWAKSIFGVKDTDKLWDLIFDICLIKEESPKLAWQNKMNKLAKRAEYLNSLDIDKLIYSNSLGTNIEIGLPKNYLFASAAGTNLVNMPTEEVFTSPDRLRVNGRVYSSKPLIYNGNIINNFYLEFKDGRVIDFDALEGRDTLKGLLDTDEGAKHLGEVALVDYSSPISLTNILFKNTLYDENASCHLALGDSFAECIKGGLDMSKDELFDLGLNRSYEHVDFFIGTSDLSVKALLHNGRVIDIMKEGNFKEE